MSNAQPNPRAVAGMLAGYRPHVLADTDGPDLMRRYDRKFIMSVDRLPDLLQALEPHYTALEIDERRVFRYESLYFDTPAKHFFQMHHSGHLNRYKVRHRIYADTDTRFLEVKFKDNHRCTEKSRIPTEDRRGELHDAGLAFLEESVPEEFTDLHPSLLCRFRRIALASPDFTERVTLDFGLRFSPPDEGETHELPRLLVVELKQRRPSPDSPLYQQMRAFDVRPHAFSKYCVGCCLVAGSELKANRFKPTLARVREISEAS